jgi:hypothetical protein
MRLSKGNHQQLCSSNTSYLLDDNRGNSDNNDPQPMKSRTTEDEEYNESSTIDMDDDNKKPHIAWFMSFPNLVITYTLKFIQGSTQTATAINYGYSEQT